MADLLNKGLASVQFKTIAINNTYPQEGWSFAGIIPAIHEQSNTLILLQKVTLNVDAFTEYLRKVQG